MSNQDLEGSVPRLCLKNKPMIQQKKKKEKKRNNSLPCKKVSKPVPAFTEEP